eukprot:151317-Chlamydomonas_euryale.AAC.12
MAPGAEQMDGIFLKAGLTIAQLLLKVICFAWGLGVAPGQWQSAVIASLYKGKGPIDVAGSYGEISLLSTACMQPFGCTALLNK